MEHAGVAQIMNGAGSNIKIESELKGLSPGGPSDEDIYEDAGDLEFTIATEEIYLTRIPKFLWKSWSLLEADEEIHLGTVRVEGDLERPKRVMSLLLTPDMSINHDLPKEYNMQVTNWSPGNTFIFTEKDLPGYNSKAKSSSRHVQDSASLPFSQVAPRPGFPDRGKSTFPKYDKNKKWQPYYKRAVPKKTALAGQVRREINCRPVENQEYRQLMDERAREALKSRPATQVLGGRASTLGGNLLQPGTLGAPGTFNNFIKTTGPARGKTQEFKAARIPQNELLDMIHEKFKKYRYWSLKTLKAELNQPEAYLKQTLELVAHLVRNGPHAMTWELNQDSKLDSYEQAQYDAALGTAAPETGYGFDGVSDAGEGMGSDDDEDVKL
ncbi:hypothetical protein MMC30_008804 [Trapelia coarctata]|nr:hypothetical protein [Trapelia coarctata]